MPVGIANMHIDMFLTDMAVGYRNEDFVAKEAVGIVESPKETGKIAQYGREHYRLDFTQRARGANTPSIDWQPDAAISFEAEEFSIKHPVDIRDRAYFDNPYDADADATMTIMDKLLLKLEDMVATLMATSGNFGGTTGAGTVWATSATATPVANMRAAMRAIVARTGVSRRSLYGLCSDAVWEKLINCDELKKMYINTVPGASAPTTFSPNTVASLVGLAGITVGAAVKLTAKEGQADAFADVWSSNTFAVYRKSPRPTILNPGFAAIIVPQVEGMPKGADVVVDRYWDPDRKSDMIRGTIYSDQIAVTKAVGQLITGV